MLALEQVLLRATSLERDAGYLVLLALALLSRVNHGARHSTVTKIRARPEAKDHDGRGTLDQHLQSCHEPGLRARESKSHSKVYLIPLLSGVGHQLRARLHPGAYFHHHKLCCQDV